MDKPLIVYNPHPITTEGKIFTWSNDGVSLKEEVLKIEPAGDFQVEINGILDEKWNEYTLKMGDIVSVRPILRGDNEGTNPIAAILSIAVLLAAPSLAGLIAPKLAGAGLYALRAVVGIVGILVVNSLFPPRLPKAEGKVERQYSISGGSNQSRPYERIILLLGMHRVFPDYASKAYTEYDTNSDQFLNQIYDFGIGNLDITDNRIGDTLITSYDSVSIQKQTAITIVAGNVKTIDGGDLDEDKLTINRTTSSGSIGIAFDIAVLHFESGDTGNLTAILTTFQLSYKLEGTASFTNQTVQITGADGAEGRTPTRRSYKYNVPSGTYEVRVRLINPGSEHLDDERVTFNASLSAIRTYHAETADFNGRNPFAIRIKATGQLYSAVASLNSICYQKIQSWNGTAWVRNSRTSNPADIYYKFLRGWYDSNHRLIAGMGLPEIRIDLPVIQAFADFCTVNGLECNLVVTDDIDRQSLITLILQCGWGSIDKQSGKYGVVWENEGQALSAIINPDNVIAGTMNVSYDSEGLADEVIGTFIDESSDYEVNTIRRTVPGVTHPIRPVDVALDGITSGVTAAKELNRAVAAQFYHIRSITWEMGLQEAMSVSRGDVVGISHGLVGLGKGGRFLKINVDRITITGTAKAKTALETGWIWIWDLNGNVLKRTYTSNSRLQFVINAALPAFSGIDDPTAYRYMAFSNQNDIELAKLRIVGKEPVTSEQIRLTARDEIDLYYDYRTSDLSWQPIDFLRLSFISPVDYLYIYQSSLGTRVITWAPHSSFNVSGYDLRWHTDKSISWANMKPLSDSLVQSTKLELADLPPDGSGRIAIAAVLNDGKISRIRYSSYNLLARLISNQRWWSGDGEPQSMTERLADALEGDFYLDTSTNVIWILTDGAWVIETDLSGADTAVWYSGSGVPARTLGKNGDFYFRTSNATIWEKIADSWENQIDIDGEDGAIWLSGSGVPSTSIGNVGDFYFRTDNGFVYEKTSAAIWSFRRDITGPPGLPGEDGEDGTPGEDGVAREWIFAQTARGVSSIPVNQRPLSTWLFDRPLTRNGLQWHDGAPDATDALPLIWVSWRVVTGNPEVGDTITSSWKTPVRNSERGRPGEDGLPGDAATRGPGLFRVSISASQRNTLTDEESVLPQTFVTLANNATPGENLQGDFVVFFFGSSFSSAWTWDGTIWRYAVAFIGAQLIQAIEIRALMGDFGDLNVTGVLSAEHLDADVRNATTLLAYTGDGALVSNIWRSFSVAQSINDFDAVLLLGLGEDRSGWGSASREIARRLIPTGSASSNGSDGWSNISGRTALQVNVLGSRNLADDVNVFISRNSSGMNIYLYEANSNFRIKGLIGFKTPGYTEQSPPADIFPPLMATTVTANAGSNVTRTSTAGFSRTGSATVVNGVGSTAYAWSRVSGHSVALANANNATVSITPAANPTGTTVIRLTATNNGVSDTDDFTITWNISSTATTVTANAGSNVTRTSTAGFSRTGSATVVNGVGSTAYAWSRVSGHSVLLTNANTSTVSITPTANPTGTTVIRLTATNNGVSDTDDFTITWNITIVPDTLEFTLTTPVNHQIRVTITALFGADQYRVRYKRTSSSVWSSQSGSSSTTKTISLVDGGTSYDVQAAARVNGVWTAYSGSETIITTGTNYTAPSTPPANFTAVAGSGSVALSWNAVANATAYIIQRKLSSASVWSTVVLSPRTTYTYTGLTSMQSYDFRIKARRYHGNDSPYSSIISATPT